MELTRKQFDVLSAFATSRQKLSQRQLEDMCDYSLGTVNKIVKELTPDQRIMIYQRTKYFPSRTPQKTATFICFVIVDV